MADWDKLANQHSRYKELAEKYRVPRPRKLLSLDGGGIRGVITLQVLAALEDKLKKATNSGEDFRLGDYFDYIGGTSTGAIIAACLAFGFKVEEVIKLYDELGAKMFKKPLNPLKWLWYKFKSEPLTEQLREIFGTDDDGYNLKLGSGKLRCLLLIVMRNVTSDSFWPVSSNPFAKYNLHNLDDKSRVYEDSNLYIPLYKLVRGSTAAPTFFSPEVIFTGRHTDKDDPTKIVDEIFKFEDGGVTPYNNPAFLLYRMATVASYQLDWETGEDKLLLISVGTGASAKLDNKITGSGKFLLKNAALIPSAMMYGALVDQDINCRVTGLCVHGAQIDSELETLIPKHVSETEGPMFPKPPGGQERKFLYARYNAELNQELLEEVGFPNLKPEKVGKLDSIKYIEVLRRIGEKVAREVNVDHFGPFVKRR